MRKYGISKGANIAKSLGFKTKASGEAGKRAVKQVAKGSKNRLTPGEKRVMSEYAARDKARLKRYRKDELEELKEVGFGRIAGQGREF